MSDETPPVCKLRINGELWSEWDSLTMNFAIDNVASFTLVAPWDPERADMREAFAPFNYQDFEVEVDGLVMFAGVIVTPTPEKTADGSSMTLTGYAYPGVLQDCDLPADRFPLQWSKQRFREIAESVCEPFGVEVDLMALDGAAFDTVKFDAEKKPWENLCNLAKQRQLLLGSTHRGKLAVRNVPDNVGAEVFSFQPGDAPLADLKPQFKGQEYYSEVTAMGTAKLGARGGKNTVRNSRVSRVRPLNFTADKSERGDLPKAAAAKLSRVIANAISYPLTVPGWRNAFKDLWEPGHYGTVHAPEAMIYKPFRFLIRTVTLSIDETGWETELGLTLPEAFSEKIPEVLPWD